MQDDSALPRTFFARTNRLAALLGVNVEELPEITGIKRRTLFECRKEDSKVSLKSWAKLEEAECRAGVPGAGKCDSEKSSGNPKWPVIPNPEEFSSALQRDPADCASGRGIPLIGWAHAGEAGSYEEIPKSWQSRITTDCPDPNAFAVSLEGDSMEPKFSDGDILIVQPSREIHSGCYVVARFADDGVIFRRLEMRGAKIILVPLNTQYQASEHMSDEFSWIYPVWCRITKLWRR